MLRHTLLLHPRQRVLPPYDPPFPYFNRPLPAPGQSPPPFFFCESSPPPPIQFFFCEFFQLQLAGPFPPNLIFFLLDGSTTFLFLLCAWDPHSPPTQWSYVTVANDPTPSFPKQIVSCGLSPSPNYLLVFVPSVVFYPPPIRISNDSPHTSCITGQLADSISGPLFMLPLT